MPIFTGTYENKVDGKGRVSLPADFRDLLSTVDDSRTFYIFPSPKHHALEACDKTFVENLVAQIENQTAMFSDEEDRMSSLLGSMRRVSYDSTGRFVLPDDFADDVGIGDSARFVGVGGRFTIWNPTTQEQHNLSVGKAKGIIIKRTAGQSPDQSNGTLSQGGQS